MNVRIWNVYTQRCQKILDHQQKCFSLAFWFNSIQRFLLQIILSAIVVWSIVKSNLELFGISLFFFFAVVTVCTPVNTDSTRLCKIWLSLLILLACHLTHALMEGINIYRVRSMRIASVHFHSGSKIKPSRCEWRV